MIRLILFFAILNLASCGPARDASGNYWTDRRPLRKIFAHRSAPKDHQLKCPTKP